MTANRRYFLKSLGSLAALCSVGSVAARSGTGLAARPQIACNQYTWHTFYQRQGRNWSANLDASLADFAKSGLVGYEPSVNSADEIRTLAPLLKKHKLEMHSLYVNSTLHKADEAGKTLETVTAIADAARPLGLKIVVTNPSPIGWGRAEGKTDDQLAIQATNLDRLGAELKKRGMTLAYHTHDVEMRNAAREFHHMMLATDPDHVSLCLDVHWIYRGSGNSQVALFDIVKLYGKRIAELHLRQSQNGVWSETFGEGDIDYPRLAQTLKAIGIRPHLVLEQCIEKESPNTLDAVTAHRQDLQYVKKVFG
ncbi:inosose dehydratase [Larkinella arboricola]|uniref:Inosose dehydratase n=1 Tax=Larkinella arboricola TaxID=643671 RepID=A0A327XDR1_LARAB|nr:sugar phosphate isomerase/epimerase family protein [Larkinella arboricola]RAK02386.1 inosose dehydratase [Larkinella arboricola]